MLRTLWLWFSYLDIVCTNEYETTLPTWTADAIMSGISCFATIFATTINRFNILMKTLILIN